MLDATPTKLRNGDWGARVEDPDVQVGAELTVKTRSGESWETVVQAVVSRTETEAIVATQESEAGRTAVRGSQGFLGRRGRVSRFDRMSTSRGARPY